MIRSGLKRIRSVTNAIFDAVLPEKKQKVEPESKSKWMSYTEILEALARLDNIPPTFTTLGLPVYSSNEDSPLFELAPLILQRAGGPRRQYDLGMANTAYNAWRMESVQF